jgi:hypothetical protein
MDITAFLLDIEPRRAMASQATIPGQTNRCRCRASVATVVAVDDIAALTARNEHFIEACRRGSWEQLRQILGRDFRYLDGRTGQVWDPNRYAADLLHNPAPSLAIGEVVIHVAGNTATVSAAPAATPGHTGTTATWTPTNAATGTGCARTPACGRCPSTAALR